MLETLPSEGVHHLPELGMLPLYVRLRSNNMKLAAIKVEALNPQVIIKTIVGENQVRKVVENGVCSHQTDVKVFDHQTLRCP